MGADPALEDRAERGDARSDPDLPERVVDPRCHARLPRLDHADRRRGEWRVDEPDPDAPDDEAGEEGRPARVELDVPHQKQRSPDDSKPATKQEAPRTPPK